MISKVSNNKAFMRHNFMCGVQTKRKFALIIFVLHLAAAPAVAIAAIASVYARSRNFDLCSGIAMIGVCTTALAGALGIYLAIDSFSCLHNKNVVDMLFSLPLNASQRFFSNYLSGLTVYILPFLAAQIFSVLAMGYGCIFMDGRTFERYIGTNPDTGEAAYTEYVCRYFGGFMPMLLKLILCGVLVMLMLYTLSVLVTVCCGNIFESIGANLLINAVIPFTILFVFESMFMNLYGIGSIGEFITMKAIMYTSPAGGIFATAAWVFGSEFFYTIDAFEFKWAIWITVYVLLTAAMFAGAFFLYKKRRAQQTGKPFAFKFIYYVISTALMFFMTAMFGVDGQPLVTTVLATFLVYLALECITRRGFKRIWVGIIRYACTIAASVLLIRTAQTTEGFGMVERVPNVSSVKSVEINYNGFYNTFPLGYEIDDNLYYFDRKPITLTFNEKENIEIIIAAHQKRVDNRDFGLLYNAMGQNLTIKYNLTGGRKLTRTYDAFTADELEILSKLDLTDEYKTQIADMFRNGIKNFPQEYEANYKIYAEEFGDYPFNNYTYVGNDSATLDNVYDRLNDEIYTSAKVNINQLLKKGFFDQLAEAYAADIMNISEENYYNSTAKESYYFYMRESRSLSNGLDIPGSFENTIELMEYFGFKFDKKEDLPNDGLKEYLQERADRNGDVRIYSAKEWRSCFNAPEGVRLHGDYGQNHPKTCGYIKDIDEDIIALFKAAEPMNILPENGYIIYVSGETGVIPSELNGVAERVYEGAYGPADDRGNPFWLVSNYDGQVGAKAEVYTETQPNLLTLTEVSD